MYKNQLTLMENNYTTATAELAQILKNVYNLKTDVNTNVSVVWLKILTPLNIKDRKIQDDFCVLLDLIRQVKYELISLNDSFSDNENSIDYLDTVDKIQEIFLKYNPCSNYSLKELRGVLNEEYPHILNVYNQLIITTSKSSFEKLKKIQEDIKELIVEMSELKIDIEIQTFIIEKLKELDLVITRYKTQGKEKIKQNSSQIIGEIILFCQGKEVNGISAKILKIIDLTAKLNGATGFIEKTATLLPFIDKVIKHLPPGN